MSIQVGLPAVHGEPGADDPLDQPWRTGFFKAPVAGPVWLGRLNLVGDGQANRRVHGGPDKAVLAYAASHYPMWRTELNLPDLPYGAFAENFTVDGQDEAAVCLGDVYAIGTARVQVSQPTAWAGAPAWASRQAPAPRGEGPSPSAGARCVSESLPESPTLDSSTP